MKDWKGDYLFILKQEITHCASLHSWIFTREQIDPENVTHDDLADAHTPTSGCSSQTSSLPFPSNRKLSCVQATGAVLAHLTDEKRKHSHVLWVNLQEELVLEGNGQIFTPREPSCPDQHIPIPSSDPQVIEVGVFFLFFFTIVSFRISV